MPARESLDHDRARGRIIRVFPVDRFGEPPLQPRFLLGAELIEILRMLGAPTRSG